MKNFVRRKKGVTLSSLVITIVVMIIIASISTKVVFGENGIIAKAKDVEYEEKISVRDRALSSDVISSGIISKSKKYMKNIEADYIQPWYVSEWEIEDFDLYFKKLKENQINTCILQYCSKIQLNNNQAYFSEFYFWVSSNNEYAEDINNAITSSTSRSSIDVVGNMIKAAKDNDIKVFIGLGNSDGWFDEEFKNEIWRNEVTDLNNKLISYLISEYKATYPNTFEGIYFPLEFYSNSNNYEELYWKSMLNDIRTTIKNNEIEYLQSMPVMISTYCSQLEENIISEEQMKSGIRQLANALLENDIICTQDKIATNYDTDYNYNLKYLSAIRNAINDYDLNLEYWINVETFYPIPRPSTGKIESANMSRVSLQIKIASMYADKLTLFSYGHYYFSKLKMEREFHDTMEELRKTANETLYNGMQIKYFEDGTYVPIPDGFYYISGNLQTGVVISDLESDTREESYDTCDGNQFVWIPIDEKKFKRDDFKLNLTLSQNKSALSYWEDSDAEYKKMYNSIIRYKGFYVGRYESCIIDNKVRIIEGQYVKNGVTLEEAKNYCSTLYQSNKQVKPHIMYGVEWDSMLNSFIGKTNSYNNASVTYIWLRDSQNFGNYGTIEEHGSQKLTGHTSMENTQIYNIFDLAGNFWEITQEKYGNPTQAVLRGGSFWEYGGHCPISYRFSPANYNDYSFLVSFRVALYLK